MDLKNIKPAAAEPKMAKTPASGTTSNRLYYLLIAAVCFVLYGNTIGNRYALDDSYVTGNNPLITQGIKAIPGIFSSYYISLNAEEGGQHNFGYRPIAKVTYAIEYQIFGENPSVSHFINILLYALTGILLFRTLRRLLSGYHVLFPLISTLLFLAHPVHTEVVASLKNREELLSFLGALGALWYFIRYADTGKKRMIVWGALMLGLGFLSKANVMTFLVLIPLVLYFFTNLSGKKITIAALSMLLILAAALIVPRLFLGAASRPQQFIENPLLFDTALPERLGTGMMTLLFYLKKLIYPHPLLFYYGYNMLPVTGLSNPLVWISLLLHAGMLGIAIRLFRKKHLVSFALLFYLINIAVYANIVSPLTGVVAERSLYIASLGLALLVAAAMFKLAGLSPVQEKISGRPFNVLMLLLIVLITPAAAKTITRNNDWKDELTLYAADMPYLEQSAKANFIYATNLRSTIIDRLKSGIARKQVIPDAEICIRHFKRATAVYPKYADAWNNLGEVYLLILNEPDSAIQYFEKATFYNPEFTAAFYNLGYTYQITDQPEKAIPEYEKALELEPYEIRAMSNLAQLYHQTGDDEKAIKLNEDIIILEPNLDVPYINLGTYAMRSGDAAKALDYFEQAAKINPGNFELNMKLRNYFIKVGDSTKADYYLELARRSGKKVN